MDADSGLVFVGLSDSGITEIYTVPEPEEGFYVIAAEYNGEWLALNTIVDEHTVRELIPELKRLGACGIVEYPLNKIVE